MDAARQFKTLLVEWRFIIVSAAIVFSCQVLGVAFFGTITNDLIMDFLRINMLMVGIAVAVPIFCFVRALMSKRYVQKQ